MVQVLLKDQFVDAVDNVQIRVYIQQAHVQTLQEALARGLELESILRSNPRKVTSYPDTPAPFRARRGFSSSSPSTSQSPPPGEFRGNCFGCGQQGHSRRYCPQKNQGKNTPGQYRYRPCCWHCGRGHVTSSCPSAPPTVTAQGNPAGLEAGAPNQPAPKGPRSI